MGVWVRVRIQDYTHPHTHNTNTYTKPVSYVWGCTGAASISPSFSLPCPIPLFPTYTLCLSSPWETWILGRRDVSTSAFTRRIMRDSSSARACRVTVCHVHDFMREFVCVCACVRACACVCVRVRERERECVCACVFTERARARARARARERERERETDSHLVKLTFGDDAGLLKGLLAVLERHRQNVVHEAPQLVEVVLQRGACEEQAERRRDACLRKKGTRGSQCRQCRRMGHARVGARVHACSVLLSCAIGLLLLSHRRAAAAAAKRAHLQACSHHATNARTSEDTSFAASFLIRCPSSMVIVWKRKFSVKNASIVITISYVVR